MKRRPAADRDSGKLADEIALLGRNGELNVTARDGYWTNSGYWKPWPEDREKRILTHHRALKAARTSSSDDSNTDDNDSDDTSDNPPGPSAAPSAAAPTSS
eukprot:9471907-Pyramimonas_sp.AAC.2